MEDNRRRLGSKRYLNVVLPMTEKCRSKEVDNDMLSDRVKESVHKKK